jgi:hypothetical protein
MAANRKGIGLTTLKRACNSTIRTKMEAYMEEQSKSWREIVASRREKRAKYMNLTHNA